MGPTKMELSVFSSEKQFFLSKDLKTNRAIVNLVLDQSNLAMVSNIVNAIAYLVICWNIVDVEILSLWFLLITVTNIARIVLHDNLKKKPKNFSSQQCGKILNMYFVGLIVSGGLWGIAGGYVFYTGSHFHILSTVFIFAGLTTGCIGAYSVWLPAVRAYLSLMIFPIATALLFVSNQNYKILFCLLVLYFLVMLKISKNLNTRLIKAVSLGIENEDLLKRLNNASHEIKTPITTILGFSEILLKNDNLSIKDSTFLKIIYKNASHLKTMVQDILMYSKATQVEGSTICLLSVGEEIDTVLSSFSQRLQEKSIFTEVCIDESVPQSIYCDALKYHQILSNLISNSVKYTPKGEITISVTFDEKSGLLTTSVADSGIGIGDHAIENLFEPFYRENRWEVEEEEGAGLGLDLSLRMAKSAGGDLRLVYTEVDQGSIFEFDIKVEVSEVSLLQFDKPDNDSNQRLKDIKVILVEDAPEIQALIKTSLEGEGAEVDVYNNGREIINSYSEDHKFDVMLMDIRMPFVNGCDAAKNLRDRGCEKPILALSAYMAADIKRQDINLCFDEYICKSVQLDHLTNLIVKWSQSPQAT